MSYVTTQHVASSPGVMKEKTDLLQPDTQHIRTHKRKEISLLIVFSFSIFVLNALPAFTLPIRYIVLPLIMLSLYRQDSFDLLIFPLLFLDDSIGTYVAGRVTLLWFYSALLLLRYFYERRENKRIRIADLFLLMILTFFIVLGFSTHGMVYIKVGIATVIALNTYKKILANRNYSQLFFVMVISSTMVPALSLVLGLGNEIANYNRLVAFGFTDPNYSAAICCVGLAACLYIKKELSASLIMQLGMIGVYVIAIVRAASITGIAVACVIVLLKVLLEEGVKKKVRVLLMITLLIVVTTSLILPYINGLYFDSISMRIADFVSGKTAQSVTGLTSGRLGIASRYLEYFEKQNILMKLFGGNVSDSIDLFQSIGARAATHNTYIDLLIVFGMLGSIFIFVYYASGIVKYWRAKKEIGDAAKAIIVMKLALLVFSASLSYVSVPYWWYILVI